MWGGEKCFRMCRVTTLLIASAADRLLPSMAEGARLASLLPNARRVALPDSGHTALLEEGVALAAIMSRAGFLPDASAAVATAGSGSGTRSASGGTGGGAVGAAAAAAEADATAVPDLQRAARDAADRAPTALLSWSAAASLEAASSSSADR